MMGAILPLIVPLACAGSTPAPDQPIATHVRPKTPVVQSPDVLEIFKPQPSKTNVQIKYELAEAVFRATVLRTGPSERVAYSRPRPHTGTRVVLRDRSRFRYEGNKLVFAFFNDETKEAIFKCKESLISLSERLDIQSLPRNEQLAYWFNLHNILVISALTENHPVTVPSEFKLGPNETPLHEAPIVTIKGIPLSLNDIRIGIVYRYWDDPRVIYGFFRGDLASPNIRAEAWKASTLSGALNDNAREFINALRGVRSQPRGQLLVSQVYDEARSQFFPNWPDDLRTHLMKFADSRTKTDIARGQRIAYSPYERRTADLTGGAAVTPNGPLSGVIIMPDGTSIELWGPGANPSTAKAVRAIQDKITRLHRRRLRKVVEIEDEPFTDSEEIK